MISSAIEKTDWKRYQRSNCTNKSRNSQVFFAKNHKNHSKMPFHALVFGNVSENPTLICRFISVHNGIQQSVVDLAPCSVSGARRFDI